MPETDGRAFWEHTPLDEMTDAQWESLCDGCGKCCLHRLQGEDGRLIETSVACKLLDTQSCQCSNYAGRFDHVKDCVSLRQENIGRLWWLPGSCAYRRVARGEGLADWHHLVSGDRGSVHEMGISVRGRVVSERHVKMEDLEQYILDLEDC